MAREVIGGLIKKSPHNKNYKELYDIVYNLKGRFVLKGAVQTYNELLDTHPEPHIGDAVHVIDDFRIYRWNGKEWEVSIDLSDLEIAENERIANEIIRVASENTRVENEDSRVTEENIRKTSEITRVENEEARELNENTRRTKEQERVGSETDRQLEEGIRQANEQTRVENESIRVFAEGTRIANEDDRKLNEQLRQDNEIIREQLKHIGEYQSTSVYSKNNMVIYNGSTFIALKNIPIDTPPNVNLDTEYWQRVALRGDIGIERRLSSLEEEVYEANYSPELENTSSIFSLGTGKDENGSDIDVSGSVVKGQVSVTLKGNTRTNLFNPKVILHSNITYNPITNEYSCSAGGLGNFISENMTIKPNTTYKISFDIKCAEVYNTPLSNIIRVDEVGVGMISKYESSIQINTIYSRVSIEIPDTNIATNIVVLFRNQDNKAITIKNILFEETTEIKSYIPTGTKSTVGAMRLRSVGKNIAYNVKYHKSNQYQASVYADCDVLQPSTKYTISIVIPEDEIWYTNEHLFHQINITGNGELKTITTTTKDVVSKSLTSQYDEYLGWIIFKNHTGKSSSGNAFNFQIEKGTIPTPYEPYIESTQYITAKDKDNKIVNLRSLPNGTKDEVSIAERKMDKRIEKYVLQASDILGVSKSLSKVDQVRIAKQISDINYGNEEWRSGSVVIKDNYSISSTVTFINDIKNIWTIFPNQNDIEYRLIIPKDTYASLEEAQSDLTGTTLTYQLAEPEIIPIETHGVLKSFGKGTTVYVETAEDGTLPTILYKVPINMKAQLDDTTMCSLDNKERVQELEKTAHNHTNKQVLDYLEKNEDGFLTFEGQEISGDVRVANLPEQVIDDNIIFIGDTRPLEEMIERDYATKVYAKDYTDSQVALITETGIPKLTRLEYILRNVQVGTTQVQIPSDNFDGRTDTVDLYINTTHKNSDDYTYTEAGLITLAKPLEAVSTLTIHVLKNVPMGEDGSVSGKVIAAGSMPSDRVQGLDAHLADYESYKGNLALRRGLWSGNSGIGTLNLSENPLDYEYLCIMTSDSAGSGSFRAMVLIMPFVNATYVPIMYATTFAYIRLNCNQENKALNIVDISDNVRVTTIYGVSKIK